MKTINIKKISGGVIAAILGGVTAGIFQQFFNDQATILLTMWAMMIIMRTSFIDKIVMWIFATRN